MILLNNRNSKAFTSIDWMLLALIVFITLLAVVPNYINIKRQMGMKSCYYNRQVIKRAVVEYLKKYPYLRDTNLNIELIKDAGIIDCIPMCPEHGKYRIYIHDKLHFDIECTVHGR